MPPIRKFSREEIIDKAEELVSEKGINSLSARTLAKRLGTSSKPIFGLFSGMEEVKKEVLERAKLKYKEYIENVQKEGKYPLYKSYGIAYIRFAQHDKELFRSLFMRDRTFEKNQNKQEEMGGIVDIVSKVTGLDKEKAFMFHLEMWIFIHGLATTIVTSYEKWEDELIDKMITDHFVGLKYRFSGETQGKN